MDFIVWPLALLDALLLDIQSLSSTRPFTLHPSIPPLSASSVSLAWNLHSDIGVQSDQPIDLPNVSSSVLSKILEWCEHHRADPPAAETTDTDDSRRKTSEIGEWDSK
jgi:S-phase kinase-associated protein 1